VIAETGHPSAVEPGRRPSRSPLVIVAVALVLAGLVFLGFGIDLWANHVSYAACVGPSLSARISQAQWNYIVAHCRSVGALRNLGIVLTFSGAAAVLLGVGTAFVTRRSSTRR
jgi:uncharacterized membrane protein YphA (DoxX/SURF4 family)